MFHIYSHSTSTVMELLEFPLPNAFLTWQLYDPASDLTIPFSINLLVGTKAGVPPPPEDDDP